MVHGTLRDSFGPLEYVVHDIILQLPRRVVSKTCFVATESIILNLSEMYGMECYRVTPLSMYGVISKMEAVWIIKQYIWNNFFELNKSCTYCESAHYPIAFRYNLKNKLHIKDIDSLDRLQEFILHVMNAVFDRVVYTYDLTLLAIANDICEKVVKMDNVTAYKIKEKYKHWIGI